MAAISSRRQVHWVLVVTGVPSIILNGSGNFAFVPEGTAGILHSLRWSSTKSSPAGVTEEEDMLEEENSLDEDLSSELDNSGKIIHADDEDISPDEETPSEEDRPEGSVLEEDSAIAAEDSGIVIHPEEEEYISEEYVIMDDNSTAEESSASLLVEAFSPHAIIPKATPAIGIILIILFISVSPNLMFVMFLRRALKLFDRVPLVYPKKEILLLSFTPQRCSVIHVSSDFLQEKTDFCIHLSTYCEFYWNS
jgi:hypothetical protein